MDQEWTASYRASQLTSRIVDSAEVVAKREREAEDEAKMQRLQEEKNSKEWFLNKFVRRFELGCGQDKDLEDIKADYISFRAEKLGKGGQWKERRFRFYEYKIWQGLGSLAWSDLDDSICRGRIHFDSTKGNNQRFLNNLKDMLNRHFATVDEYDITAEGRTFRIRKIHRIELVEASSGVSYALEEVSTPEKISDTEGVRNHNDPIYAQRLERAKDANQQIGRSFPRPTIPHLE